MSELKPCGHCGRTNPTPIVGVKGDSGFGIMCSNGFCGARVVGFQSPGFAAAAWNTRTPSPASDEAMAVGREAVRVLAASLINDEGEQAAEEAAAARIIQQYREEGEAAGFRRGVEAAAALFPDKTEPDFSDCEYSEDYTIARFGNALKNAANKAARNRILALLDKEAG